MDRMKHALSGVVALVVTATLAASCGGSVGGTGPPAADGGGQDVSTICGASGEACCNGAACDDGLVCISGTCAAPGSADASPDSAGESGVLADASPSGAADADATTVVPSDGALPTDAPAFDAGNCATAVVDPVHGVFVAPGGTDSVGCGTAPTSPCQSIGAGVASATADGGGRDIVYVSAGVYTETVTLDVGVTVQGGWHWGGSSIWSFDCGSSPESAVTVQAPSNSNATVVVSGSDGNPATLSTLTVLSKAASAVQPGESLYGVFATGASTVLALTDVIVTMQAAGAGLPGTAGAIGSAPPVTCSAGNGKNAAASTAGAVGATGTGGSFSSAGYTTHTAGTGGNGTAGGNGMAGGPGASVPVSVCATTNPCTVGQTTCVGAAGLNGCGGEGGVGGSGGGGGGSSVAIFAYDAAVIVTAGAFRTGDGGNGGAGGAGGSGGSGSGGSPGLPSLCEGSSCSGSATSACAPLNPAVMASGGASGTEGGNGSVGGRGGGGAGGDSDVIVTGGSATSMLVLAADPALLPGKPGTGAANGPSGIAVVQRTF